jgi:hypothetical protein
MARGDINIPKQVRADMRRRFASRIKKTVDEFDSAAEDEDVMTGHLGANLTTHARKVHVPDLEIGGTWTWSLTYRKFRGRGPKATEKRLGADGIFELVLNGRGGPQVKSMLFQSKMEGSGDARGLVTQCAQLTTWREAAAVLSYGPDQFDAFTLDAALGAKGHLPTTSGVPLADFLADTFVGCEIGDTDLRYHADERMLTWRDTAGDRIATRFAAKHRLRISVKPPTFHWSDLHIANEISADEIAKHRMAVSDRNMLGLDWEASSAQAKRAQKSITKVYHPDLWQGWPDIVRDAMEARTKEVQAIDLSKLKH